MRNVFTQFYNFLPCLNPHLALGNMYTGTVPWVVFSQGQNLEGV